MAEGHHFRKTGLAIAAGLVLSLAAATPASAADFYVDSDGVPATTGCTNAMDPCDLISEGVAAATANGAGTPDTVHVGPRSVVTGYPAVTVGDTAVTLVGDDYTGVAGGTGDAFIDGVASVGVTLDPGTQPRTVDGFRIQGGDGAGFYSLLSTAQTGITVSDNLFDDGGPALIRYVLLQGSPIFADNRIVGTDKVGSGDIALDVNQTSQAGATPQILRNQISGVERGMDILGDNDTNILVAGNTIEVDGADGAPAYGIGLNTTSGVLRDNVIHDDIGTAANANGIYSAGLASGGTLQLLRNDVFDMSGEGVALNTPDPVTLNGDVIAFNGTNGVSDLFSPASLTINNATIWSNGANEVLLNPAGSVTIDSTIIGPQGVQPQSGTPPCTATFSRGPAAVGLCAYATTATPNWNSFVAFDGTGYRLTANNPTLIDMGNPAAAAGTDSDGDPLALDGLANGACLPRRDIGADEAAGLSTDCPPPVPAAVPGPTGQQAAALKKCKKKKSAKKRKKCRKRAKKLPV